MKEFKIEQKTVFGLIVIVVGIVLLLNGLQIIDADISIGKYWPLILILLGIVRIINFDESTFFGGVLVLIGAYFQLRNLNVPFVEDVNFYKLFWPVIIILFGLSMLFPDRKQRKNPDQRYDK